MRLYSPHALGIPVVVHATERLSSRAPATETVPATHISN